MSQTLQSTDATLAASDQAQRVYSIALGGALAVFAIVTFLCAWLGDDAYITFRTMENFLSGYGLRWNIDERVQTYTHPLWMLLLLGLRVLTGEIYFTAVAAGLVLSWASVALLALRLASTVTGAVIAVILLILSRAVVDYNTSGLENPLSFLLVVLFLLRAFRDTTRPRDLWLLSSIAALGMMNRLDLALIFAPVLAVKLYQARSVRSVAVAALGFLPLILWEIFAVIYYGFPFPNTAYAKLGTGLSPLELLEQGSYYFLWSFANDLVTMLGIMAGIATAFFFPAGERRVAMAAAAGALLYLAYIAKIGGDFMGGRFFSVPLVVAACLIARCPIKISRREFAATMVTIVFVGFFSPRPTLLAGGKEATSKWEGFAGIINERLYYTSSTGIFHGLEHGGIKPDHPTLEFGKSVSGGERMVLLNQIQIGILGWAAGPAIHILDPLALGDPLLARLPAAEGDWRIGHFFRMLPKGYVKTVASGKNQIQDPSLAEYYDRLALVTRGPLWTRERWEQIWRFNIGANQHLVREYLARTPQVRDDTIDTGEES